MEDTLGATRPAGPVQQAARDLLVDAAVRYAEERHWEVSPGTWLIEDDGPLRCSCGDAGCPAPGAHPATRDWARKASAGPGVVRRWWTDNPLASVLLPTGRTFDAIDVPEIAGCLALARMERMGLQLGPVLAVPGDGPGGPGRGRRLVFLVLPGSLPKLPELLRRLGWGPGRLDLVGHGEGDWVIAPPTRVGVHGFAQWAREPTALNRWLPEATELINPIAYACGREAPLSSSVPLSPSLSAAAPMPAAVQ
ncbi:bifunctional DNA primase/polymerase [Streptacidiphilus sp. PB12-B1b]|uniref:bifunctional DNA primase/polymerase n=1 Tax=Streptacidiphilus sp. PB12-B1b TaxID=2705012 RepID=UPI0015F8011C|nr:bifunctional DNA primase/polymerase [Streptacidiphilus sp. PB12-B1b]QMU74974.1 bifunctional DNA primase/polymerase [Streptacidiphilus sp. PB12-B1b]